MAGNATFSEIVADVLVEWTQQLIDDMTGDLQAQVTSKRNSLAQSIEPKYVIGKGGVEMNMYLNDYYEFVDQGVSGVQRPISGSVGSFKNVKPSKSHVNAVADWITDAAIPVKAGKKSVMERRKSMAWAMATNIKKFGLKPKPFFEKNLDEKRIEQLSQMLTDALGQKIEVDLLNA